MKNQHIDYNLYKPYLDLFNGLVPVHGGFAIGVERLVAKYLGICYY